MVLENNKETQFSITFFKKKFHSFLIQRDIPWRYFSKTFCLVINIATFNHNGYDNGSKSLRLFFKNF